MKAVTAKCNIWKRQQRKIRLIQFQIVYFIQTSLFTEKFEQKTTIRPGIFPGFFRGRAPWDSVSARMNTWSI